MALTVALVAGSGHRPSSTRIGETAPATARAAATLDSSRLWLTPSAQEVARHRPPSAVQFIKAVDLYAEGKHAEALTLLKPETFSHPELSGYVRYYMGLAQLGLGWFDQARQTFSLVRASQPRGYLGEAAALGEAEAAESAGDHAAAVKIYEALSQQSPMALDEVLLRLARAAATLGDRERAATAYVRVYFEFPLGEAASVAAQEMKPFELQPIGPQNGRYRLELARGERLFGARRYAEARRAFEVVQPHASGDDRELVDLRVAECDYHLQRHANARRALKPYTEAARRQAEAWFFYASATRAIGSHDTYVELARRLVDQFPDTTWAEDALNSLGTHYILINEDERAAEIFAELYRTYPDSRHSERAAWKAGWSAFKHARYDEAIRLFADATRRFPRSDYRPSFQYWMARAQEKLGNGLDARSAYRAVVQEYGSSYYGRLALSRLPAEAVTVAASATSPVAVETGTPPPTAELIRGLLSLELYDLAMDELRYAQRRWGGSPIIEATIGWIHHKKGDLRLGITAVKRAYPNYLSDAGALLPDEVLKVIFPLDYWDLIRKHAAAHDLDPYLIAALMAQESTFVADIRSSAGAIGLMQIMPSTGRRLARTLKIRGFRTSMLTRPEINIRMGMLYFANLRKRFGGAHLALASYNAGDHRVARWLAERPGLEQDEFIDDIPFPETQNYVKKILGTAEDYRVIYGAKTAGTGKRVAG